ncbi:hypothetical protein [Burkholderia anthina]|uniref:hypothetical protein n=1 Tax=Burkholderia anthina TaxID=179879 RepID=UPI0031332D4E
MNTSFFCHGFIFLRDHSASRVTIDERRDERTKDKGGQDRLAPVFGTISILPEKSRPIRCLKCFPDQRLQRALPSTPMFSTLVHSENLSSSACGDLPNNDLLKFPKSRLLVHRLAVYIGRKSAQHVTFRCGAVHVGKGRALIGRHVLEECSVEFLKLAIIFGTVIAIAKSIQLFSRHSRHQYGYSFFTARGFWLAAVGINLTWWGYVGWGTALLHHEPTWAGLVLMAMGLAAVIRLIYDNIRNTTPLYGVPGSILQLVLFFPVAVYGIPLLAIAFLFLLVVTFRAGPAYFSDRK